MDPIKLTNPTDNDSLLYKGRYLMREKKASEAKKNDSEFSFQSAPLALFPDSGFSKPVVVNRQGIRNDNFSNTFGAPLLIPAAAVDLMNAAIKNDAGDSVLHQSARVAFSLCVGALGLALALPILGIGLIKNQLIDGLKNRALFQNSARRID